MAWRVWHAWGLDIEKGTPAVQSAEPTSSMHSFLVQDSQEGIFAFDDRKIKKSKLAKTSLRNRQMDLEDMVAVEAVVAVDQKRSLGT